jgi:hypothetical protein
MSQGPFTYWVGHALIEFDAGQAPACTWDVYKTLVSAAKFFG